MSRINPSPRRKRLLPECDQASSLIREPKRPRVDSYYDATSQHYLDTLSKIWLTRGALKELNRRTLQTDLRQERPRTLQHQPFTRGLRRELERKLHLRYTFASEFISCCGQRISRELKSLAKHGGPDLRDLRGHPPPVHPNQFTMSSANSSRRSRRGKHRSESTSASYTTPTSSAATKTSRSSGAYDPNFEQRMIDDGIYPDGYEYPDGLVPPDPLNFDTMMQTLAERRPSLSPSVFPQEKYREFRRADAQVSSENRATHKVIPMIQGTVRDERCVAGDLPFNNLANLMSGKPHSAKPDLYYGARPEQLSSDVRAELAQHIEPSSFTTRPIAPNFFVEAKGPSGSAAVARNQACYDGALGARAMHRLQTYGDAVPTYDNNAYTISNIYHSGQLKMYAHHAAQPNGTGSNPEYYMTQLRAFAMTDNSDTLRQGMAAFRNAQEWTEAQRNTALEHANSVWDARRGGADADEDEDEDEAGEAAGDDPLLSSFTSVSSFRTGQQSTRSILAALQEAESSPDELASDWPSPQRPSNKKSATQRGGKRKR